MGCGLWIDVVGVWIVGCGLWTVDSWNGLCVVGVWCVGMILTSISTTLFLISGMRYYDVVGLWVVGCGLMLLEFGLWVVDCGFLEWIMCCGCMVCWNDFNKHKHYLIL